VNLSEPFIRRPIATSLLMAAVAFTGIAAFPFLPVASLPQIDFPTFRGTGRAGSDFHCRQDLAAGHDDPAELPEDQSSRPADYGSRRSFRNFAADSDQRLSRPLPGPTDISGAGRRAGADWRRPAAFDPHPSRPAKLAATGLTLEEIRTTIVNSTTNAPKGNLYTDEIGFIIAANDQIIDADPFNDVVLAYRNGGPIRVRDVGQRSRTPPTGTWLGTRTTSSASF
jgi:AcrB/AcrD/AcrF family